ncbi:hypothetical protein ABPG74_007345 [Tetrahymena malaccensis]
MDKLFHFQAENNAIKIKGQGGQQFYSDAEAEEKPLAKKEVIVRKDQPEAGSYKLDIGYATDENSDNENLSLKATSKMNNSKLSKFKNLSTQKHDGDDDLSQEEDLNHEQSTQSTEQSKLKIKKSNSILENARKEIASVSSKNHLIKQQDVKYHIQQQERLVDSDAEVKNVAAKNEIIDSLKNHKYRHLIFSNYIAESSFKKHLTIVYRGLVYSTKCLRGPSDKYIESKKVMVKRPSCKIQQKPNSQQNNLKYIIRLKREDTFVGFRRNTDPYLLIKGASRSNIEIQKRNRRNLKYRTPNKTFLL